MINEIIKAFEQEFPQMKAERDKQWFGTFKSGYETAIASRAQNHVGENAEMVCFKMENTTKNHFPGGGKMVRAQSTMPDYNLHDLTQIIMSDCGISTAQNEYLYDRIFNRLMACGELKAQTIQEPLKKYCKKCSSFRTGDICHKCNGDTFIPHSSFTEPKLPSIDLIRQLAKEVGYAIGVHGTQERDLDVIAAPWSENAVGNYELMQHIAKGLNAVVVDQERKPLGRYAATIQIDGWYKQLDLSICPKSKSQEPESKPPYCLGYTHEKCDSCQHNKTWHVLNELPNSVRLPIQKFMQRVNSDKCRMTNMGEYESAPEGGA